MKLFNLFRGPPRPIQRSERERRKHSRLVLESLEARLAPTGTPLTSAFTFSNITGDYVAAGDGLRGLTAGSITIGGIPGGASIAGAYLYYAFLDNGESASLKNITINGTAKVGTKVGSGPDTCWTRTDSHTYRADVTAQVTGNGTYSLTGVASGGNILAQGASLVVVYTEASEPLRDVVIYNGNNVIEFALTPLSTQLGGYNALGGASSAKTTFVVGDGQTFVERVQFASIGGTLLLPNNFAGSDGDFWDTKTHDVSSEMAAGAVGARAAIRIPAVGDCLQWSAQVLSVRTPAASAPGDDGNGGDHAPLHSQLVTANVPTDSPAHATPAPQPYDVDGNPVLEHAANAMPADALAIAGSPSSTDETTDSTSIFSEGAIYSNAIETATDTLFANAGLTNA